MSDTDSFPETETMQSTANVAADPYVTEDVDPTATAAPQEDRSEDVDELIQFGLQQIQSAATELAQGATTDPLETASITIAQYEVGFVARVITKPGVDAAGLAAASATAFRADTVFVVFHHDALDLREDQPVKYERELACVVVDRELGAVELAVPYASIDGELKFGDGEVRPSQFSETGFGIAQAINGVLAEEFAELPEWIVMNEYYQGVATTFKGYGLTVILESDLSRI